MALFKILLQSVAVFKLYDNGNMYLRYAKGVSNTFIE